MPTLDKWLFATAIALLVGAWHFLDALVHRAKPRDRAWPADPLHRLPVSTGRTASRRQRPAVRRSSARSGRSQCNRGRAHH